MGLIGQGYGGGGSGGSGGGLVRYNNTQLDTSEASSLMQKLPSKASAGEVKTQARKAAEKEKDAAHLQLYAKYKLRELHATARILGTHANYQAGAMRIATQIQSSQLTHSRSLSEYQLTSDVHQEEHNVWSQSSGVNY